MKQLGMKLRYRGSHYIIKALILHYKHNIKVDDLIKAIAKKNRKHVDYIELKIWRCIYEGINKNKELMDYIILDINNLGDFEVFFSGLISFLETYDISITYENNTFFICYKSQKNCNMIKIK